MPQKNANKTIRYALIISLLFLVSGNGFLSAQEQASPYASRVQEARELMKNNQFHEAFNLLLPLEANLAGNTDYDYLLGIAALESGNPEKASLVLERVLIGAPNFIGARIDMGRAYYEMGNLAQAEKEFERVLSKKPPELARNVATHYLALIKHRSRGKRFEVKGYAGTAVGYDTNVNNSSDENQIFVPALNVKMNLSPTNVETGDSYGWFTGGMSGEYRLTPVYRAYVSVDGRSRVNRSAHEFNINAIDVRGGVLFGNGTRSGRIGLTAGRFYLSNETNRTNMGGDMEWRWAMDNSNIMTIFAQYNSYRYPEIRVNDFDQVLGGLSWIHSLKGKSTSLLISSLFTGYEFDLLDRADGEKTFYGIRTGCQTFLKNDITVFAGVGQQYGDYHDANEAFLKKREDWQFDASAGLAWMPIDNLTIKPLVLYIANDSNISIYEYARTDLSITLRYDFL